MIYTTLYYVILCVIILYTTLLHYTIGEGGTCEEEGDTMETTDVAGEEDG